MSPLRDLSENPAYQLWLATNAWQRQLRKELQPLDLTHVQYTVLASVAYLGEDMEVVTQTDVCKLGSLDPNMVSEVVRSLVKRSLLTRVKHPNDGRAHGLELTPAGSTLVQNAKQISQATTKKFFEPLGSDVVNLAEMLRRVSQEAIKGLVGFSVIATPYWQELLVGVVI